MCSQARQRTVAGDAKAGVVAGGGVERQGALIQAAVLPLRALQHLHHWRSVALAEESVAAVESWPCVAQLLADCICQGLVVAQAVADGAPRATHLHFHPPLRRRAAADQANVADLCRACRLGRAGDRAAGQAQKQRQARPGQASPGQARQLRDFQRQVWTGGRADGWVGGLVGG